MITYLFATSNVSGAGELLGRAALSIYLLILTGGIFVFGIIAINFAVRRRTPTWVALATANAILAVPIALLAIYSVVRTFSPQGEEYQRRAAAVTPENQQAPNGISEQSESWNLPGLAARTRPAVVLIIGSGADGKPIKTGTGFFVSKNGRLVTNWHVINGCSSAVAKTEEGAIYRIEGILNFSTDADLAILQANARNVPFLTLAKGNRPRAGDRVAAVGSPLGLEGTLSEGIISSVRGNKWLQMTAAISHGSSGSPVLNSKGSVIGVATQVALQEGAQSLNFARPASYVSALLGSISARAKPRTFADVMTATASGVSGDSDFVEGKTAGKKRSRPGS